MKQNTFHFCVLFYTTVSNLINTFSLYFNRLEVAISQKLVPRFLFQFVHKHNYTRASYDMYFAVFSQLPNNVVILLA